MYKRRNTLRLLKAQAESKKKGEEPKRIGKLRDTQHSIKVFVVAIIPPLRLLRPCFANFNLYHFM